MKIAHECNFYDPQPCIIYIYNLYIIMLLSNFYNIQFACSMQMCMIVCYGALYNVRMLAHRHTNMISYTYTSTHYTLETTLYGEKNNFSSQHTKQLETIRCEHVQKQNGHT